MIYKYVYLIGLSFWLSLGHSQSGYFNLRLDFYHGPDVGFNAIELDSSYLITSGGYDSTPSQGIGLTLFDFEGRILSKEMFTQSDTIFFNGRAGGLAEGKDHELVMFGGLRDSASNSGGVRYKLDRHGQITESIIYNSPVWETGRKPLPSIDGGTALFGTSAVSDSSGNFWLLKVDSLGTVEWEQHYGSTEYEEGISIAQGRDGGYLMAGWTKGYGTNDSGLYDLDILLIKTDAQGNEQWHKTLGGPYGDNVSNIISTADGGYVLCGAKGDTLLGHVDNYLYKYYLAKLDSAGNLLWERTYGERGLKQLYSIRELSDGSLVSCGDAFPAVGYHRWGVVLKVAANGDNLWLRRLDNLTGEDSRNSLRDIRLTSDGGFILTGELVARSPDTLSSPTTIYSQDLWVLKLDSMGCDTPGCAGMIIGIEEQVEPLLARVYPNPSTGRLRIETPELGETDVVLYESATGREAFRRTFRQEAKLDVSDLPAGVYLYRLASRQGKQRWGRWVKE